MTKRFITFAAIAALLVAGCGEEQKLDFQPVAPKGEKAVSLRASVPQTKVLADNAGTFKWQNGDHITVITDGDNIRQFSTTDAGFEATFSGTIPTAENIGAYALYPASESHVAAGDMIEYHLDGDVVWSANATNMPMLGKITGSGVKFKAIGGVLKLVLYNIPAEADYLQFVATNKQITGAFDIDDASAADVTIATANTDNGTDKELVIDFSANYSENKVFYIPLPTGTIDGFTLNLLDAELNEVFTQTTKPGVEIPVAANHLILGPAVNCAGASSLWSENFNSYVADDVPSGKVGDVTYSCTNGDSNTKVYTTGDLLAGGDGPELLIGKKGGTFTAAGIPTNGLESLVVSFKTNRSNLNVTTPTDGIVLGSKTNVAGTTYSVTITNTSGAQANFTLVFAASSDNARIDDIVVESAGSSASIPVITSSSENLTIGVGNLSQSVTVGITKAVDDLGVSCIISKKDDKPIDWIKSAVIEDDKLTVTANDANGTAEDREAILTLRASGAQPKVINLKQTSALVQKPASIGVLTSSGSFTAQWEKAAHATEYKAYLHTAETATPATGGIELTPSLEGSTYTVTKSGLTNGSNYYLYVKVNAVDANYIADETFAVAEFTPKNEISYVKVTAVGQLESGARYLIVNEENAVAFNGGISTSSYDVVNNAIDVSIIDGKIVSNATVDAASFIITGTTDAYIIKSDAGYYIGRSSKSSGLNASTEASRAHSVTFDASSNAVIVDSGSGTEMHLRYNSAVDQNRFRYYAGTSVKAVQLYKLNDPRASVTLSFAEDAFDFTVGSPEYDSFTPQTVTSTPSVSPITYAITGDTGIASGFSSSTGAFTLTGTPGTATITASFAGDASYKPAEASYTVTVKASSINTSTEANPYSVSDVLSLIGTLDSSTEVEDVYVKGIVSKIVTAYSAEHGNVTFNISADGTTAGDQFQAYRATASSADHFQVGDAVLMVGTAKNYNGDTPEYIAGATAVTVIHKPSFTPNGGSFTEDSKSVTISAAVGTTIYYTIDGTDPTTSSSVYSSALTLTATTTVKAIAVKDGLTTGIASATFTKNDGVGETTVSMTSFDAISGYVDGDANISYAAAKGAAATAPAVNSSQIRIYQNGGLLTITANNSKTITNITIGSAMATKVQISVDGGTYSSDHAITAGGTYSTGTISASTVTFKCTGTDKNSRLYLNSLSVTYE